MSNDTTTKLDASLDGRHWTTLVEAQGKHELASMLSLYPVEDAGPEWEYSYKRIRYDRGLGNTTAISLQLVPPFTEESALEEVDRILHKQE